jgi:cytochrome c5
MTARAGGRRCWLRGAFVAWVLALCAWPAGAQDTLRTYLSELLTFEGQQVLRTGKPVRYQDGEAGEQLRRLLDPRQAPAIVQAYYAAVGRNEKIPPLELQLNPLIARYATAFRSAPGEYEEEYLDALNWLVQIHKTAVEMLGASPAVPTADPASMRLAGEARRMLAGTANLVEAAVRDQMVKELFTSQGRTRALAMADELARIRLAASPPPPAGPEPAQPRMRPVLSGQQAYNQQCVACHAVGVAGAPRFGDRAAWKPRLARGLPALVRSTIEGKGAMPPKGGSEHLEDVEVARATAWLANSAGGNFPEPPLPSGHSGVVIEPVRSPAPPRVMQPMVNGERVYSINCAVCHQEGQAMGPFPALVGAPTLGSRESAISIVLHGKRAMPAWRQLSDEDIAAVTQYVMDRFGGARGVQVRAEHVRGLR